MATFIDVYINLDDFVETKHPRAKSGPDAGQFVSKGQEGSAAAKALKANPTAAGNQVIKSGIRSTMKGVWDNENASKAMPSNDPKFWKKVSREQKTALRHYRNHSGFINRQLRDPKRYGVDADLTKAIDGISAVFEQEGAETKEDMVVWRGMPAVDDTTLANKPILPLDQMKTALEQGLPVKFRWDGFTSTSFAASAEFHDAALELEIGVPKGSKALALGGSLGAKGENEVLLPAGSTFQLLSIKDVGEGRKVLQVAMLPDEPKGQESPPSSSKKPARVKAQPPAPQVKAQPPTPKPASTEQAGSSGSAALKHFANAVRSTAKTKWDGERATQAMGTAEPSFWDNLSPEQKKAINGYVRKGEPINAALRDPSVPMPPNGAEYSAAIDELFERKETKTKSDMVVIRSMPIESNGKEVIPVKKIMAALKSGLSPKMQWDGYVSTSFASEPNWPAYEAQVEIAVPKGSRALALGAGPGKQTENEVLLPKDSAFRVVSVDKTTWHGFERYNIKAVME